MPTLTLRELAEMTHGEVVQNPDLTISSVVIDSREVKPDSVFFAIKGERLDGHQFVPQALQTARAAVVERVADSIPRVILLGRLSLYGQGAERLHEELVPITTRWVEPSQRRGPLQPFARDAEAKTLDLLERSLTADVRRLPGEAIQRKLLDAAPGDIEELLPALTPRGEELAAIAIDKLRKRGEREAKDFRETLERQLGRVREELARHEGAFQQLTLGYDDDEKRQLETNMSAWRKRLEQFTHDLEREPQRIRDFYEVRATRIEPVGLVYLWPETN